MVKVSARRNDEDGFVLLIVLMIVFLIVSIVSMVMIVSSIDARSNSRARAQVKARFMAESVSDAIYASIAREKSDFLTKAQLNFAVDPTQSTPTLINNPLFLEGEFSAQWFTMDTKRGTLKTCDESDIRQVCFVARASTVKDPLKTDEGTDVEQMVLDVIARGACVLNSEGKLSKCVYRNFQQVFRTRTYVDYVQMTEYEGSGPGDGAKKVSYVPSDDIDGIVHSNDEEILYCGEGEASFSIKGLKNKNGQSKPTIDGLCGDAPANVVAEAQKFLPGQFDNSGTLSDTSVFTALAECPSSSASSTYCIKGDATIIFAINVININGNIVGYPSNGVIYVQGHLTVGGPYSRAISLYAQEGIRIMGSMIYFDGTRPCFAGGDVSDGCNTDPPPDDVLLGLATSGNIEIQCTNTTGIPVTNSECDDVNVVGVLNAQSIDDGSTGGRIYNTAWDTSLITESRRASNPPRIRIYGSIISTYRPVFGSFVSYEDGIEPGTLKYGWAKTLTYDSRLALNQPPYFFRTTQANVVRATLEESPCGDEKYSGGGAKICVL